jgi:glycolate oxidase iron-sulfur subunit
MKVVYHSARSMQHGQRIVHPLALLQAAGFEVLEVPDGLMCCGSAGVYNLLQPKIANDFKRRKVESIRSVQADVAATGNIGCMTQLSNAIGDEPKVVPASPAKLTLPNTEVGSSI